MKTYIAKIDVDHHSLHQDAHLHVVGQTHPTRLGRQVRRLQSPCGHGATWSKFVEIAYTIPCVIGEPMFTVYLYHDEDNLQYNGRLTFNVKQEAVDEMGSHVAKPTHGLVRVDIVQWGAWGTNDRKVIASKKVA
jgi:hypothetical protein